MSSKKNFSLFGMPEDVVFCKECVISNQKPNTIVEFNQGMNKTRKGISFNKDGVCSACEFTKVKENKIDWKKRESDLENLLKRFRKKKGYDVIVPSSGGKDSSYTAHLLKYKYNMNPLTVTWAPHLFTDIGWQNLQNSSHVGGFDNILHTPNGKLHRLVTKLAFENLMHPFQPFIIGQKLIGPMLSVKFDVPLVMYGENQAEYGNSIEENSSSKMSDIFFATKDIEKIKLGGLSIKEIIEKYKFDLRDFAPYMPPNNSEIKKTGTEVHYLGYFVKWDNQESYYYSAEHTGFKPNTERTQGSYSRYSSIDDKIDWFHYFTTFIKFGIGRATIDAVQEIRTKKITREEGVQLVRKYDNEFPTKYFKDFLNYISINEEKFWKIVDDHRSPHLWDFDKVKKKWKLKKQVV
jgi:N-acetyl sugar amidotransferase